MNRFCEWAFVVSVVSTCACGSSEAPSATELAAELAVSPQSTDPMGPHGIPEGPPMLGLHRTRDGAGRGSARNTNLSWHSGAIMTDAAITSIFWGSRWGASAFVSDKIDGLDAFYQGVGGSSYAATNTEYTGLNGTRVGTAVGYGGHVIDLSSTGFSSGPSTSTILAEVCKTITRPVSNGYYPVYTDVPRGPNGYCAWHSYGSCAGVAVQFAFFFDLDDDAGCDPQDTSMLHSQGLAALANVSAHEYSEAVTDPRNGGWYDQKGYENSDKCAWSWPSGAPTLLALSNGTQWKLQSNWSNAAFSAGTGYPNRSGQRGCIFTSP